MAKSPAMHIDSLVIKQLQPFVLAIAFLLLYLAEHVLPERRNRSVVRHDLGNAGLGILNAAFTFIAGYFFQLLITWFNHRQIGLFYLFPTNSLFKILLQLLLIDLFMYWWHRFNHEAGFLWRFHRLHHTDNAMNSTTAMRFHIAELTLSYVARLLVFPLLGIEVPVILFYSLLFFPIVLFHHSNLKIAATLDQVLRIFIVTPHMHRIHHSNKKEETDSNYSSVFPWWDNIFKTAKRKPASEIEFGV